MTHSTAPALNAALMVDAEKLEAMGQDPGLTLKDMSGPCPAPWQECGKCGADVGELCRLLRHP